MKTAWNASDRASLRARLARLRPDLRPRWGRMSAPQMVAHLADALRMTIGDLPVAPKATPIRFTPLKQLIIYVLPFPKGVPTAPELIARVPDAWDSELGAVSALLDRLGATDPRTPLPAHPAFGRLSWRTSGVLVYRHIDHHLVQFGV